jgi:hypothetical protein
MRRLLASIATIVTLAFTLTGATFTNLEDISKYKWNPNPNTGGYAETMKKPLLGYYIGIDDGTRPFMDSFLRTASPEQPVCEGFDDPVCQSIIVNDKRNWWTHTVLDVCKDAKEARVCIEAVRINVDGDRRDLVFSKNLEGVSFKADPKHGLEAGSTASLWIDPKDKDIDRGYLIAVGGGLKIEGPAANPKKATLDFVDANVIPYKHITGMRGVRATHIFTSPATGYPAIGFGGPEQCLWTDYLECGVQSEFASNSEIELVLHLPSQITGWVFGRLDSPSIKVEKLTDKSTTSGGLNRISVSAKPVEVPLYSVKVPIEKASSRLKSAFANPKVSPCLTSRPACQHGWVGGSTSGSGQAAFEAMELMSEYLPERSQLLLPRWSFNSMEQSLIPKEFSKCSKSSNQQFQGFVTTNATVFSGTPPKLEKGFLNYKVSSLHNLPNGEEFKGSYDLVLDSQFARCLYGFSKSPVSASVSVYGSSGEKQVATTIVSEQDGWLKLSAKNFTFSSPMVKIKLSQKKR